MRGVSTVALLVGWAVVVLLLVYFLELRPRLRTTAPAVPTVRTTQAAFPAPPTGAVVFGRELGDDALAVGIVPGGDEWIVQASAVGPDGAGVSGLDVTFRSEGRTVAARPCSAGCYRATVETDRVPRSLAVVVAGDTTGHWSLALPDAWPPREAGALMASAGRVWRSLRSLSFEETLSSGPSRTVTSSWRLQAPDRLAYRIAGGGSAVVVGKRRWDKEPGGRWKASSQFPLRQPTPPWVGVTNAHVVGTTIMRGRSAVVVTFFDPKTPSWLRVVLDRKTLRTLDLRMIATAHFMHDRFHSFDETPDIVPRNRARP
jgi:hypothetical protein